MKENSLRVFQYLNEQGDFDYEKYQKIQTEGNKRKINSQWAQETTIEYLSRNIKKLIAAPRFGICHGTRRGLEQAWFAEYLGCEVIGTEISDTANQFPNTVQWDFHEKNPDWLGRADFVYSNSWDHSYDPPKMIQAWTETVRPGGLVIFEHSRYHIEINQLDPFGATLEELVVLLVRLGGGKFFVRDIWTEAPPQVVSKSTVDVNHIVVQRL